MNISCTKSSQQKLVIPHQSNRQKTERLWGGGRGALGCKQPRYPVLQPVGVGGYEGGATRLPTVMTEAELLAKMTGAGGLGKGDFRNKKKLLP